MTSLPPTDDVRQITQPNWRLVASAVKVPARPDGLWTRVLEYVTGPRKLKIVVREHQTWTVDKGKAAHSANGCLPAQDDTSPPTPLLPAALRGALIGKIGGSAADNPTPVGTAAAMPMTVPTTVPTPFGVGSFCVLDVATDKRGALFLTMNDSPGKFEEHAGELIVDIFDAM